MTVVLVMTVVIVMTVMIVMTVVIVMTAHSIHIPSKLSLVPKGYRDTMWMGDASGEEIVIKTMR